MTWTREENAKVKDARRGVVDQKPAGGKKHQDKPVIVQSRWPGAPFRAWREWHKLGRYATPEVAEQVMAAERRKHPHHEYRIKP